MKKIQEPSHRRYKTTNNNSDSLLARRDDIEEEYAAFSGEVKRCFEFATEYQSQQSSSSNFPVSLSRRQSHARWIRSIITSMIMVGYFIMTHYNYVRDIEYGTSGRGSTTNTIRSDTSLSPSCTHGIYTSPEYIPTSAKKQRVEWVEQAQDILTYIFTKLHDAPAILMYGTLLYEYRNSTVGDPCVHSSLIDKDIDIAVYPIHIQQIAAMKYDIKQKFNWELTTNQIQHSFISIFPTNYWKRYRIDIYGFQYDSSTSGLINFQWDGIKISKNAFLPIRKYKQRNPPKILMISMDKLLQVLCQLSIYPIIHIILYVIYMERTI